MTLAPKLLITLWIRIFPTEIKLCCRMLGIAMTAIFANRALENSGMRPCVGTARSRFNTTAIASTQLTPWQRKVAQATPATPMSKAVTNRMSTAMFAVEETARNQKGVRESPSAEKIPVATL